MTPDMAETTTTTWLPGLLRGDDAARDIQDALGVADGGAAVFLDDEAHQETGKVSTRIMRGGRLTHSRRAMLSRAVCIWPLVALWIIRTSGTASPSCASGWMTEEMPMFSLAEDAGHLGEDAGLIVHGDAQVILGDDLVDRLAGAVEAVRHEAVAAARRLRGRRRLRRGR